MAILSHGGSVQDHEADIEFNPTNSLDHSLDHDTTHEFLNDDHVDSPLFQSLGRVHVQTAALERGAGMFLPLPHP